MVSDKMIAVQPWEDDAIERVRAMALRAGLSVEPANREAAEEGVAMAYASVGMPAPVCTWVPSPMLGAFAANIASQRPDATLRDKLWGEPRDKLWGKLGERLSTRHRAKLWDLLWDRIGYRLWGQYGNMVWEQLLDEFASRFSSQLGRELRGRLETACYGQNDLHWLIYWQFAKKVLGATYTGVALEGPLQVALNSGWWWPFEHDCIMVDRPVELHLDDRGRLHHRDRLAVRYRDGWGVAAWHGTRLPTEWVKRPETLTLELALTYPSIEQRRCAGEMFGWAVVMEHLGANVIDHDPMNGTLVHVDLPEAPGSRFFRALHEDGREFYIAVPPDTRTAAEANDLTYPEVSHALALDASRRPR